MLRDLSVIILCGGQSRRMGQDKALLTLDGMTLLQHATTLASAVLGPEHIACRLFISRNQPGFIQDQVPQAGPVGGISAALAHCTSRYALVLPVDMPLLTLDALRPLLQLGLQGQAGYYRDFPLPVLLRCDADLKRALHARLSDATANRSLHALWHQLGYQQLVPSHMDCLLNCNDPPSFSLLQSIWHDRHTRKETCDVLATH